MISRSGRLTDLLGPSIDEGDRTGIGGPGEGSGEAAGAELWSSENLGLANRGGPQRGGHKREKRDQLEGNQGTWRQIKRHREKSRNIEK